MIKFFISILLLLAFGTVNAQYPENLVPNPGFENGGGPTNCVCTEEEDFNKAIEAWWASGWVTDIFHSNNPTPDWVDGGPCGFCPYTPTKYVQLGCSGDNDYEAVLAKTKYLLVGGQSYIFKIKVRSEGSNGLIHCEVKNIEHGSTTEYMNVGAFDPGTDPNNNCKWVTFTNVFHIPDGTNYEWIYIKKKNQNGSASLVNIDDVFISEYCTNWILRQNLSWYSLGGLEEAGNIVAGNTVTDLTVPGDVIIKDQSQMLYKGTVEVKLAAGFTAERGSDFVARIAPCGKDCQSPDLVVQPQYTICDNQCIKLSGGIGLGMTYSWGSIDPSQLQYLSSTSISNPIFCPPQNVYQGTYVYTLKITNPCGETATKTVTIFYDRASNPSPSFSIVNSNLGTKTDNPSFSIKTGPHTETVVVDITDCDGTVLTTTTYRNGMDFTTGQIDWSFGGYLDPCGCYKIAVKSKNYCYDVWTSQTFTWDRIRALTNIDIANTAICRDGKRWICFEGSGIDVLKVKIWDNWLVPIWDESIDPDKSPSCFEIPNNWSNAGHYGIETTFIGCDGSMQTIKTALNIPFCGGGIVGDSTQWDGDTYNQGGIYTNPETGKRDSMYSYVSPNPVTDYSTINYHIPKAGKVKMTLLNSNFEEKAVLLNSADDFPAGDHVMQFSNADLLNGTNYYKIELTNEQNAVHIKRFISIK